MSVVTTQLRWTKHGGGQRVRKGITKILRGSSWKPGWLIVAHNDRLMPYPTGGFDSIVTVAAGGPLNITGADANGGLRFIAKEPNVTLVLGNGSGSLAITVGMNAGKMAVAIGGTSSSSALNIYYAVKAHAEANRLLGVNFTGTGASLHGTTSTTDVPSVRLYGISQGEAVNNDASNDLSFDEADPAQVCEYGMFRLATSAALLPPCLGYLADNNTIQPAMGDLLLPVEVAGYDDDQAIIKIY